MFFSVCFLEVFFLKCDRKFREEVVHEKKFIVPLLVPWESFQRSVQLETSICFSAGPVCSGELPHLGGKPHSATAGGVPGSWTRGERSVKDLENPSEKQRQLTDNRQCTPVDLSGLGRPGDLRSKPTRHFIMKEAGYPGLTPWK